MKTIRRVIAIGACGIMAGSLMGMVAANPATGRHISTCDKKIDNMEKQAAKKFAKGKLSAEDYAKIQAEIAFHRQLWGC